MYLVFHFCFQLGNMRMFAGAVWLRMNLGQSLIRGGSRKRPKVYNPNKSVFVVTIPGSPYVFINKTAAVLLKVVTEVCPIAVY